MELRGFDKTIFLAIGLFLFNILFYYLIEIFYLLSFAIFEFYVLDRLLDGFKLREQSFLAKMEGGLLFLFAAEIETGAG